MAIFTFSSAQGGGPEEKFWKWFQKNEEQIFKFRNDQEVIFNQLSHEMETVNPDLTFELGPLEESGKREFTISAGGIKSAFPFVESLFESAPNLNRWVLIKYRQRISPLLDLEFGGKSIAAKDVHFKMYKDGEKVGIVLFLDGYTDEEQDIYGNLGYLFLDEALGEYDTEMKVGFIEFHGRDSEHFTGASPLSDLAEYFDDYFKNSDK